MMCKGCWKQYGSPQISSLRVRETAQQIKEFYTEQPVGGHFHIILDDWNLADSSVEFCLKENRYTRNSLEIALGKNLQILSFKERASALALADGFWKIV